jgi:hypothetical protein
MDLWGAVDSDIPNGQASSAQVKGERCGTLIRPVLTRYTLEQLGQPYRIVTVQRISSLNDSDPIARALSYPSNHKHTRRDRPTGRHCFWVCTSKRARRRSSVALITKWAAISNGSLNSSDALRQSTDR